jgi:hypothetical protein
VSLLPDGEYTGESNLWLPGDEYTGESRPPRVDYTGEFELPGGDHWGVETPWYWKHCGVTLKLNNSSILVLKSKLFLRISTGDRRSCLKKKPDIESPMTLSL